jgi:hypothetical protein
VREESHLDDMRAAIRGDFERLAERRGGQELMHEPPPEPEEPEEPEMVVEPEAAQSDVEFEAAPSEVEPPRKGFLARLFGR